MDNKKKGLLTVAGGAVCYALASCSFLLITLLLTQISTERGVDFTQLALMFSFAYLGMTVASMFAGKVIEMVGPKWMIVIGAATILLVLATLGLTESLIAYYVTAVIYGIGNIFVFMAFQISLTQWFRTGSGTLLGAALTLNSVVCVIANPLMAALLGSLGIRNMGLFGGIVIAGVIAVIAMLLVSGFPAKYGMEPADFGKAPAATEGDAQASAPAVYEAAMPAGRAARTMEFLLVAAVPLLVGMCVNFYSTNSYMIFGEYGLDMVTAAALVSAGTVVTAVANPLFGVLSDKIGARKAIMLFSAAAVVVTVLALVLGGMPACVCIALGASCGNYNQMVAALALPSLFGMGKSPQLIGWCSIGGTVGGMLAAPLAAAVAGATGSYRAVLVLIAVFHAFAIVAINFAMDDKAKEHIKQIDAPYRDEQGVSA